MGNITTLSGGDKKPDLCKYHKDPTYQDYPEDNASHVEEFNEVYMLNFITQIVSKCTKNEVKKKKHEDVDTDEDLDYNDVDITVSVRNAVTPLFPKIIETIQKKIKNGVSNSEDGYRFYLSHMSVVEKYNELPTECTLNANICHIKSKFNSEPIPINLKANEDTNKTHDQLYNSQLDFDDAKLICGNENVVKSLPIGLSNNQRNNVCENKLKKDEKKQYYKNHNNQMWNNGSLIPAILYNSKTDLEIKFNKDNKNTIDFNIYATKDYLGQKCVIDAEALRSLRKSLQEDYLDNYSYIDLSKSTIGIEFDNDKYNEIYKKNKCKDQIFTTQIKVSVEGLIVSNKEINKDHYPIRIGKKKLIVKND